MEITEATMSDRGPFNFQAQKHRHRCWIVKRRTKVARFRGDSALSEARRQKLIPTPSLMYVMKFMVPWVLELVTLKYQAKPESLFGENPAPLWCFVAASCLYWLILEKMKQITALNSKWLLILSHAALAFASLSLLSLLSMFITYPFSLLPLIIWIPLPVVLAWPILYYAYSLLKRGITSVSSKIYAMLIWERGLNLSEEPPNLPV